MGKRNEALGGVRGLERLCLAAGLITEGDVRTNAEMREKAWSDYLYCRRIYLRHMLAERRRGR